MKIIITEEQLEDVRKRQKKQLRLIWSVRPYWVEGHLISVGIKNDWDARDKAIGWFIEFLGDEVINKRLEDTFGGTDLRIDDCGTYNFEFDIVDYTLYDESEGTEETPHFVLEVDCKVDIERGTVTIGDEERSLDDVIHNDDYGWEVSGEITSCIGDYIYRNFDLLSTTGISSIDINLVS